MIATALIVDDSLTVRMDLAEAFEAAGFRAIPCGSVAEARRALATEPAEVVILDVRLPDGDGVELLAELRASGARVAILMLSSEAEVKDRVRALSIGADEYVGKPYDAGYVVAKARALLRDRDRPAEDPGAATILVIDDSETYREYLRAAFSAAGYRVLLAASGEDGLRIAADRRPSALVVDGVLPGIDGATVIRRVRLDAALRGTPCLLLTASEDVGAEMRALEAGADAFVRKEDDVEIVLARLAAALRRGGLASIGATVSLAGPRTILAVDDSATYLNELATLLRAEGYQVILARSGEEALDLLAVQVVDCVLLDLVMPGLGGQETCLRIKAAPGVREVPLIMLTAREDRAAMLEALSAGADDYIAKSSELEVLTARVRAQLRRKQFEDETRRVREELLRSERDATEARGARLLAEARAALAEELERKNQALERATRLKSEFLANMSHELRTPLNSILGFGDLLHDEEVGPLTARQKEFIGHVVTSGRHLLQLVNDILDLSKVEAGKLEFRAEPIDLRDVVDEVASILRTTADAAQIRLSTRVDERIAEVVIDPARTKQILYNFLSNGLKFTPAGGTVEVRVLDAGNDRFRIEVEDSGIGIAAADLPRLFTEFQQLDAGANRKFAGTGLGLALTRRLVEAQGGTIGVTSVVGRGSVFHAVLPRIAQRRRPSVPVITPEELAPAATGDRIWIIDDDHASLELMRAALAQHGFESVCLSGGERALARLDRETPAAIVLDLIMPDMDGFELLERLRASPAGRAVPVVVWTVKDLDEDDRDRLRTTVRRVVAKGAGAGLGAVVESLLGALPRRPTGGSRG